MFVVVKNGKYGFINEDGKILIRPQFLWANGAEHGYVLAYVCGRSVYLDSSGTVHPWREVVGDDLVPHNKGEKFGFVDRSGAFVIPPEFDGVMRFSENLAAVEVNGKWGFVDRSGEMVVPAVYDSAYAFNDDLGTVEVDGKFFLIDRAGRVVVPQFDWMEPPSEGRVMVSSDEGSGFFDYKGQIAIPLTFEAASSFSEGLAAVQKNGKWGFIDPNGNWVIQPRFDEAGSFMKGLSVVKIGKRSGFVDKTGNFAFEFPFDWASGFYFGNLSGFTLPDGRFGYVNTQGKVVWGPIRGVPDHAPLAGFSKKDEQASCRGISPAIRKATKALPPDPYN